LRSEDSVFLDAQQDQADHPSRPIALVGVQHYCGDVDFYSNDDGCADIRGSTLCAKGDIVVLHPAGSEGSSVGDANSGNRQP
jgi:hypothetical protein